jgi:hypothetical protein
MCFAGAGDDGEDRCVDVAVQWVRTSWTKDSRGGPAAARRNAAPVGFVLPARGLPVVHTVAMSEADGFEPHESLVDGEPGSDLVLLTEVEGRLRVELVVTPFGMPRRWRRVPAVRLLPGEWLRWQVNYRFSWPMTRGGAWTYRLDTLNVAYCPGTVDVFTGVPTRYVDERARLR